MIGPLIIVGVTLDQQILQELVADGLKDSKLFTTKSARKKRDWLAQKIQNNAIQSFTIEISAQEVDQTLKNRPRDNLNLLELRKIAQLIQNLKSSEIIIDTLSSPEYSRRHLIDYLQQNKQISFKRGSCDPELCRFDLILDEEFNEVSISTKADRKYPVVAAASCLAKVKRDNRLREIEKEWGLPDNTLGKGYPHEKDQDLMSFFKKWKAEIQTYQFPFIRYTWSWPLLQSMLNPRGKSLDSYLDSTEDS